jgi:hypothetical protein
MVGFSFDINPPPWVKDPDSFTNPVKNIIGIFPGNAPKGNLKELSMYDWMSLSHVRWDRKYHVLFVLK